jgi:hypothetical protein
MLRIMLNLLHTDNTYLGKASDMLITANLWLVSVDLHSFSDALSCSSRVWISNSALSVQVSTNLRELLITNIILHYVESQFLNVIAKC